MQNITDAIKPAFLEILAIASFVAALVSFDPTLTNNDLFVTCLFFGICLFGVSGLFADSDDAASHIIPTLFGAVGAGALVTGICMNLAGMSFALFVIAFSAAAIMCAIIFKLANGRF